MDDDHGENILAGIPGIPPKNHQATRPTGDFEQCVHGIIALSQGFFIIIMFLHFSVFSQYNPL